MNVDTTDVILRKIEEKVYAMKKEKDERKAEFDVDVHYEWLYYKPSHNLSKFKEEWNKRKVRKSIPKLGGFPLFDMKAIGLP